MGSESLTYEEKRALGYGTVTERLGKARLAASAATLRSVSVFLTVGKHAAAGFG